MVFDARFDAFRHSIFHLSVFEPVWPFTHLERRTDGCVGDGSHG